VSAPSPYADHRSTLRLL
jgi:phosphoadenosine phosphosulfate reductase